MKEGDPVLYGAANPIAWFSEGSSAEVIDILQGQSTEDGRPQTRFILNPLRDFKHINRIHPEEYKPGGLLDWTCPTEYIRWLNHTPTNQRIFVMCDYRTKTPVFITSQVNALMDKVKNNEVQIYNLKMENSKLKLELKRLSEEGINLQELGEYVALRVKEELINVLLKGRMMEAPGGP